MPEETTTSDLSAILSALPACVRCRKNKKRCDLLLPRCFNCARAEEECTFMDHVTNELLPRRYIDSLVNHIKELKARPNADGAERGSHSVTAHLIPARNAQRYLGGRAALAAHLDATTSSVVQSSYPDLNSVPTSFSNGWSMNSEMHTFLMDRYFHTIHQVYPVFDWPAEFQTVTSPTNATTGFISCVRPMVYSIACHCIPGNDPRFTLLSTELYRQGIAMVEDVMSRVSVETLQVTLLLALHCLFDPHEGSLGQQIAFANSLMEELVNRGLFRNTPLELPLRHTLYCLDNLVASVLDRPFKALYAEAPQTTDSSTQTAFISLQYQEQCRHRKLGPNPEPETCLVGNQVDDRWSSLAYTTQCETHLLVNPSATSALDLVRRYCHSDTIFTIFTAHWTFLAATYLLRSQEKTTAWYPSVLRILERCSLKWPETGALQSYLGSMLVSRSLSEETCS